MENNTENKQVANQSHEKTAKQLKKQKVRQTIVSLIGIALILWGVVKVVLLFIDYSSNETSNDAQVEQYISPVNLRASGYIKKICFQEHQSVKKGDTLLILDDREYRIRVMEAEVHHGPTKLVAGGHGHNLVLHPIEVSIGLES